MQREGPERQELARVFRECSKSYDFWTDSGLALIGSPDTVIRQIEQQRELISYDVFSARHRFGRLDPKLSHKSTRLFAEHVMPAFE